jgi:VPDSG-CTERM motif
LANEGAPVEGSDVSVTFGGATLLSVTDSGRFDYTHFTFTETASTASTALAFEFGSRRAAWFLDDVSVTPAGVSDGGTTVSLLGCALLGLAALRRKLSC